MVQVIPRNEIGLVVPKSQTKFPAPPLGLAIHWEGTQVNQGDLEQSKKNLRAIQKTHLNNKSEGYVDIAYCIAFDHLGNIFELRGWNTQGGANGTTDSNRKYVSVCYLGGPGQEFTPAAQEALNEIRRIATSKGIGNETRPHSDFKATQCPGEVIRKFIGTMGAPSVPSMPTPTHPSVPSWGGFPLPKGHYFGVYNKGDKLNHSGVGDTWAQGFIKMIQREVSVTDDGIFGDQTRGAVINYQKARGLEPDGLFGAKSWNSK
jgi:hypothetical protein